MTNEEALALVAKQEKSFVRRYLIPSVVSCGLVAVLLPLLFFPESFAFSAFVELFLAPVAIGGTVSNVSLLRQYQRNKARDLWYFIHANSRTGYVSSSTLALKGEILQLYKHDPKGETLPLVQALRLLDAHQRQQERLEVVAHRLTQLGLLRQTMQDKLERLHQLGEDAPEAKRRLAQLETDEAALRGIYNQIFASCARLETTFTGVQHAHQVRELKRELGQLSQAASSSSDLSLESDAFDIEQQIGREIETFLQLERETDEHLRDV